MRPDLSKAATFQRLEEAVREEVEAGKPETPTTHQTAPGMLGFFGRAQAQRRNAVAEVFVEGVLDEAMNVVRHKNATDSDSSN